MFHSGKLALQVFILTLICCLTSMLGMLNAQPLANKLDRGMELVEHHPQSSSLAGHAGNLLSLKGKKVFLYTKNGEGFVHDNIPASIAAIKKLGKENGFEVVASEDPAMFTDENLKQYDALIFSNTNNKAFDTEAQRKALQNYIQSGGGFVGIHSASGSERDWPWFAQMLGGRFLRHPKRQDFDVLVLDKDHPSTAFLPDVWKIEMDECYYQKHLNPANHVLLAADLTTVEDEKRGEYPDIIFGDQFPLAWYHEFEGGRQWYTALGHRIEHYSDPTFMRHILGGIRWAVGEE